MGLGSFLSLRSEKKVYEDFYKKELHETEVSLNEEIEVMIRPESILIDQQSAFQGKISHKIFAGPYLRLFVNIALDQEIIIDVQQTSNFNIGDKINLTIPDNSAIIIS